MVRTDVAATSEFYHCYPLSRMDGRDERDIRAFTPIVASEPTVLRMERSVERASSGDPSPHAMWSRILARSS